jgi:hypothetical protein
MDEKKMKLKKMATWTAAVFATIFALTFAILWLPMYTISSGPFETIGKIFASGWLILVLDLVLCVGAYLGYKFYLDSKK